MNALDAQIPKQRTLRTEVSWYGPCRQGMGKIGFKPAAPFSGIKLHNLGGVTTVPAVWAHLKNDAPEVDLHSSCATLTFAATAGLLALVHGLKIDNVGIEVSDAGLPQVTDDPSLIFALESAGLAWQDAPRRVHKITNAIAVGPDLHGSFARLIPSEHQGLRLFLSAGGREDRLQGGLARHHLIAGARSRSATAVAARLAVAHCALTGAFVHGDYQAHRPTPQQSLLLAVRIQDAFSAYPQARAESPRWRPALPDPLAQGA